MVGGVLWYASPLKNKEIMSQAISDQQFLDFYDQNVDKIYRFVFFRVPGQQEAQDLTSEIFTKTWQYITEGGAIDNPRAFLYQIARNTLADYYRSASRSEVALEAVGESPAGEQPSIDQDQQSINSKIDAELDLRIIKKALSNLKQEYQEAVILRYLNDLELKEMAEIMDKSYGAVRVLVTRALRALKRELNTPRRNKNHKT